MVGNLGHDVAKALPVADRMNLRITPWGKIAFQLSGEQGFAPVEEHDKIKTAPGGDVSAVFCQKSDLTSLCPFFAALSPLSSQISFSR